MKNQALNAFFWRLGKRGGVAHVPRRLVPATSCCGNADLSARVDAPQGSRRCLICSRLAPSVERGHPLGLLRALEPGWRQEFMLVPVRRPVPKGSTEAEESAESLLRDLRDCLGREVRGGDVRALVARLDAVRATLARRAVVLYEVR